MDSLNSCPGKDLALPNLHIDNVAKFSSSLILSLPHSEMARKSPFVVHKAIIGIGGEPKSIKKLRSGDLLIETTSALQSKLFLLAKTFLDFPLTVTPHKSLNSCRGIISEPDLLSSSETEILEGLSDQGVTQVRRITIKKDSSLFPTKNLILTFNSPKLPSAIKDGYLNCKVRPYIPNPLRCFKCQSFGHSQTSCRGQLTCSRCASVGHASTECSLEPKCINCLQPHPSDSKICSKWKIEKQIQEIKTKIFLTQKHHYHPNKDQIFLLLLQHHSQPKRNPYLRFLQKHLLCRILSHQLPCLRQKGKLKNNHLHYIIPENIAKNRLNEYKTYNKFKEKSYKKHTSVKIAREQDSPSETSPVSKKSRRRKTFKTSDAMDTDANPSDSDYVIGLASEEDESLLEADFKKVADNPLTGPLSPSSPQK
ncbi:RNA-directed DNA polymerase from mobile element jockey [Trichonephila clavipes]|nr:RNA-directed DNA polymerase from mobile element jockey [Trichonephila clavipes]